MAKFKAAAGFDTSQVLNGIKYQFLESGTNVMQKSNNNRSFKGYAFLTRQEATPANFQDMDSLINSLDAQFDQSADAANWNATALSIVGLWSLCADCDVELSGKKLFRQFNWNRLKLALDISFTAADVGTPPDTDILDAYAFTSGPGSPAWLLTGAWTTPAALVVANIGHGQNNPSVLVTNADFGSVHPGGGAIYDWIEAVAAAAGNGAEVRVCYYLEDGTPGLSGFMSFNVL